MAQNVAGDAADVASLIPAGRRGAQLPADAVGHPRRVGRRPDPVERARARGLVRAVLPQPPRRAGGGRDRGRRADRRSPTAPTPASPIRTPGCPPPTRRSTSRTSARRWRRPIRPTPRSTPRTPPPTPPRSRRSPRRSASGSAAIPEDAALARHLGRRLLLSRPRLRARRDLHLADQRGQHRHAAADPPGDRPDPRARRAGGLLGIDRRPALGRAGRARDRRSPTAACSTSTASARPAGRCRPIST